MDVVPVEYENVYQTFKNNMWLFKFITGITFRWYFLIWLIIALILWISLFNKFRINRVPPDPVKFFSRLWIYVASVHDNMDATVQVRYWFISKKEGQHHLRCEVGDILD